ncbi:MAG: S1C family serine protease [Eubacteriales bacterium]|nr:S1C family serine protease [Eubacteriales bacterium]
MGEEEKDKSNGFSFMQEKIKQRPVYQNPLVRKALRSVCFGALFGGTALLIWAAALPHLDRQAEKQEIQPIEIPEEEEQEETEEDATVYITETVSMELEDYKKLYQQLMQIGTQTEKSMATISALTTDTDWFDGTLTSQRSAAGLVIGDNGLELLLLTEYEEVRDGELMVTFFDRTTAAASLKKYDANTGLAIVSVNLSDVSESTREIVTDAQLGSSKSLRSGEPVIAVGNPLGSGSILFGNLTSVSQTAALYDSAYNVLTTDILEGSGGSGVLVDWDGRIIGLIQSKCEVSGQNGTIQAYGISDMKSMIEHLSNNQDIVYMGIVGADVTTAISEREEIPVGVYVSQVTLDSPAIEAGIQPGDIITSMSGQTVTNLKDMMSILLKCSNGQSIDVICQRPGMDGYQELELSVTLKILE